MSKKIRLIFGVHNHQPSGNFDHVFEDAYENSYLPFIVTVEKHPNICVSIHYSGILLNWLEEHKPEFISRIKALVSRGNIELLSGAFYEPVLPGIPEEDRIGQIVKQNQYIRNTFGYEAQGMWLAEKVWEPDLPKSIEQARINYIALDEDNFYLSGITELPVKGYYNTENEGHTIGVFSISKKLKEMLMYTAADKVMDYLHTWVSDNKQDVMVVVDDGEKFRKTQDDGDHIVWLDEFFTQIEKNSEWIKTCTFKKYRNAIPPLGLAYFSSSSYLEMDEWALATEQQSQYSELRNELVQRDDYDTIRPFIRGGVWRNFMTRYAESNWMQKRVQQIKRKYHLLETNYKNKNRLRTIRDHLWFASCNDVYWHGHFGGIYLPHLRHAVWKSMIKAEKMIEEKLYNLQKDRIIHHESDIDRDGHNEIQMSGKNFSAIFSRKYSGAIIEFDYRPSDFNIFDSVKRYPERYHKYILEKRKNEKSWYYDKSIDKNNIVFDSKPRYSLFDRYFDKKISAKGVYLNKYPEASDFINESVDICNKNCDNVIVYEQKGWINWQRSKVRKEVILNKNGFDVDYTISNIGLGKNEFSFGPEFNFSLHSGQESEKRIFASKVFYGTGIRDFLDVPDITYFGFENESENLKITLSFSESVRLIMYPLETIVLTQNGFEKIYQSTTVLPLWKLSTTPGKTVKRTLNFKIEPLK